MAWVTDILGVGAAAASGGLFGVLGSAFGAWMKAKERKQKAIEQQAEREHELKVMQMQMSAAGQEASWQSMTTSQQGELALNKQPSYLWVSAAKSLFRPFLTLTLWAAVAWQLNLILTGAISEYMVMAIESQALFSATEIVSLVRYVVYSTVFSATTATTWWFGERALSLPEFKK